MRGEVGMHGHLDFGQIEVDLSHEVYAGIICGAACIADSESAM